MRLFDAAGIRYRQGFYRFQPLVFLRTKFIKRMKALLVAAFIEGLKGRRDRHLRASSHYCGLKNPELMFCTFNSQRAKRNRMT